MATARSLLDSDPGQTPGATLVKGVTAMGAAAVVSANLAGWALVFGLLAYVLPIPAGVDRGELLLRNLLTVLAYGAVAIASGLLLGLRETHHRLSWLRRDQEPDLAQMEETIQLPMAMAKLQAWFWIGGTVLLTALNLQLSHLAAFGGAVVMLIGTLVMAAINYLLLQRIGRGVMSRALEAAPLERHRMPGVMLRTFLVWMLGTGLPLASIAMVAGVGLMVGADAAALVRASLILAVVALASGLVTILLFGTSLASPLREMRTAVRVMQTGNFGVRVPVYDASELGFLQAALNQMADGLDERERMRDLFGRHVGPDVARRALEAGTVSLGGEARTAGVLFIDIIGSTQFMARTDPSLVITELNRFFGLVVEVVHEHGGLVNKFEGDAALCVWGAPLAHDDPGGAALQAGRELLARLDGDGALRAAIGVSAGEVIAGNIGAKDRLEYTVIGTPVIEAARLCELAKGEPSRILAKWTAVEDAETGEAGRWELAGEQTLRGRPDVIGVAVPSGE